MGNISVMSVLDVLSTPPTTTPRIWRCGTCGTPGQLAYRRGWVVVCPCPACPAPATPDTEYNPTAMAAIRHWNWKQGGPK